MIAAFDMQFDKRLNYCYKANTEINCVAIRKRNWKNILQEFPYFSHCLKVKVLYMYERHIKNPL